MRAATAASLLVWGALGCSTITGNFDRVIAIEIIGALQDTVQEGDTTRLHARALSAAGDSAPDAVIVWEVIDVDSGQLGFVLDTASGTITGQFRGSGRVRARVESLVSQPVTVTVLPVADSLARSGADRIVVPGDANESEPLGILTFDLPPMGEPDPVGGSRLVFSITSPAVTDPSLADVTLTADQDADPDPFVADVVAGPDGTASTVVSVAAGGGRPDSLDVTARAFTPRGVELRGSPVTFTVVFAVVP